MPSQPDNIESLGKRFARLAKSVLIRVMDRTAIYAAQNIIAPGGLSREAHPVNASKLTNRSGRLLRAITGAGGQAWTSPESSRSITAQSQTIIQGDVEIRVPYARIHELGGTIPALSILMTPKMRRFLWAMYYKTGEEKFKYAAFKKGVSLPERTIGPRPFMAPAMEEVQKDYGEILREELAREFQG